MLALALFLAPAALPEVKPPAPPDVKLVVKEGPAEALMRQAQQFRYAYRWYEAVAAYRAFLAQFPTSDKVPYARFYLAACLERDQRWDEGAAAYTDFLAKHPDQRQLGKEAKLGRISCWAIRQGQNPEATPGLLEALRDGEPEVRVKAALELARTADRRALPGLKEGLGLNAYADRCTMALIALGEKLEQPAASSTQARFLVIRIQEPGKDDKTEIRLGLAMARALSNYISTAQAAELRKQGIEVDRLGDTLGTLPKGSLVFSVQDKKSSVTVTVE